MKAITVGALIDLLEDVPRDFSIALAFNPQRLPVTQYAIDISKEELTLEHSSTQQIVPNGERFNAIVLSTYPMDIEEEE